MKPSFGEHVRRRRWTPIWVAPIILHIWYWSPPWTWKKLLPLLLFPQCRFTSTETVRAVRDWAPQVHPLLIFHTDGLNCRMCDESTWHHKTFRVQLHWHLAIIIDVLYCRCIHPQTPTFYGFYTRSSIMQRKVRAHRGAAWKTRSPSFIVCTVSVDVKQHRRRCKAKRDYANSGASCACSLFIFIWSPQF